MHSDTVLPYSPLDELVIQEFVDYGIVPKVTRFENQFLVEHTFMLGNKMIANVCVNYYHTPQYMQAGNTFRLRSVYMGQQVINLQLNIMKYNNKYVRQMIRDTKKRYSAYVKAKKR